MVGWPAQRNRRGSHRARAVLDGKLAVPVALLPPPDSTKVLQKNFPVFPPNVAWGAENKQSYRTGASRKTGNNSGHFRVWASVRVTQHYVREKGCAPNARENLMPHKQWCTLTLPYVLIGRQYMKVNTVSAGLTQKTRRSPRAPLDYVSFSKKRMLPFTTPERSTRVTCLLHETTPPRADFQKNKTKLTQIANGLLCLSGARTLLLCISQRLMMAHLFIPVDFVFDLLLRFFRRFALVRVTEVGGHVADDLASKKKTDIENYCTVVSAILRIHILRGCWTHHEAGRGNSHQNEPNGIVRKGGAPFQALVSKSPPSSRNFRTRGTPSLSPPYCTPPSLRSDANKRRRCGEPANFYHSS